ncbi:PREDICTED: mRNAion factor [Prunus dulcis]|uniref:PREDICTED: mRNAion factor n=1 Tax=Prunus dulcis TaxID=3755 RepID=A0A5E4EYV1_PRUDU|nr:PREDICTED: mRNAion factor [Prunus dulcis]
MKDWGVKLQNLAGRIKKFGIGRLGVGPTDENLIIYFAEFNVCLLVFGEQLIGGKTDRASIVGDAIDYIKELLRTVDELKLLVEKKRCGRERSKRRRTEQDGGAGDDESCNMKPLGDPHDQSYNNGSLRSSWLQRKSKDTEVDIRIIDDEVTIKLVQRKKINLLLYVSKLLDELQLDLHHVAGGHIGNSYSFLFNTKMYEGSSLYASAIAQKLIEVLDKQYAAVPPTNSF